MNRNNEILLNLSSCAFPAHLDPPTPEQLYFGEQASIRLYGSRSTTLDYSLPLS